jgi:ribosomal protein S4
MLFKKKNRYKPRFKQFLKLRENVQNNFKILKFKNKKWEKFLQFYRRKLKRYKKFKPKDQAQYIVTKFPNKTTSYKKRFYTTLLNAAKLRLFYGNLSKKEFKKKINLVINKKTKHNKITLLLTVFESRLDTILYRSKFSNTFRSAKQDIVHGKILVNNKIVRIPSYEIKQGDIITIQQNYLRYFENNLKRTYIWPIPPKNIFSSSVVEQVAVNHLDVGSNPA